MAFRKRKPGVVVDDSKTRLDGMIQIDNAQGVTVNYGSLANPLTKAEMKSAIQKLEDDISSYNQLLDEADTLLNGIVEKEAELNVLYTRVLKGAVAQFGPDSNEVEVLGGTRQSERKSPVRKNTDQPPA